MRKNVTEYLDITEGLYSEKIAVEDANGCITFGEMKRNALKIAEFCVEQNMKCFSKCSVNNGKYGKKNANKTL